MTDSSNSSEITISTGTLKGFRDFYPADQRLHNWIFSTMGAVAERFGFQPYNGPVLESKDMYVAKSGGELGGEQLYSFMDKGDRAVAIRPEMTPTLARMVAAKANELTFPLRWYSVPNLLRYERPQRGRTREHWQINVDIVGSRSVYAEAEILNVGIEMIKALGARDGDFVVKINNRRFMNDFLRAELEISPEQITPVMQLIDRKAKMPPETFQEIGKEIGLSPDQLAKLNDLFGITLDEVRRRFADSSEGARELCTLFDVLERRGLGAHCRFDLEIVRGIAYYTGTVFELHDTHPENRRALFGGGRYDNLMSLFNKPPISCVGFGFGDVTAANFLEKHNLMPQLRTAADVMVVFADASDAVFDAGNTVAAALRSAGVAVEIAFPDEQKFDKQMKSAGKREIPVALIVGPDELAQGQIMVKDMRARTQRGVPTAEVIQAVQSILNG